LSSLDVSAAANPQRVWQPAARLGFLPIEKKKEAGWLWIFLEELRHDGKAKKALHA
jgi:hypothetical protein